MFYFYEIFYDFKNNIYKNKNRKLHVIDKLFLVLTIALGLVAFALFELKSLEIISIHQKLYHILLIICITFSIIFYLMLLLKISKDNKKIDFIKLHKENVTDKIIELLNCEQYNCYNVNKIDWLIDCCNKVLNEKSDFAKALNTLKSLSSLFLPLLTLALGIIIQKFSNEELIYYIAIIGIGFILFCICSIMLIPIIEHFSYPNKKCFECLLGELEFIKTELSDK